MKVVFDEAQERVEADKTKNVWAHLLDSIEKYNPFHSKMAWGRLTGGWGEVIIASSAGRVPGAPLNQDLLINQTPAHQAIEALTRPGPGGPGEF